MCGKLCVFTCADEHSGNGLEVKLLLSKLNGGEADGDGAAIYVGAGSDGFSDAEGVVEEVMKEKAAHAGVDGHGVCGFDLCEDLVFAEHLGVESCGDFEKVGDDVDVLVLPGVFFPVFESVRAKGFNEGCDESGGVEALFGIEVELNTIAGADDGGFADGRLGVHLAEHLVTLVGRECNGFAYLHGAVVVGYVVKYELHGTIIVPRIQTLKYNQAGRYGKG